MDKNAAEALYSEFHSRALNDWKHFLSFKSVSTDPAYTEDCNSCASWLINRLNAQGFKTELLETKVHPVVFAERPAVEGHPTVLFYGHYDVQPVDPLHLWQSDPFVPVERDGRLYARGAQDNKGQVSYFLSAIEALIERQELQCGVKILLEGEEECGSSGLIEILPQIGARLKADRLLVCDTCTVDKRLACITMGLRGIAHLEVRITGPSKDLHSGVHGGW